MDQGRVSQTIIENFLNESDHPPQVIRLTDQGELTLKLTGPCPQCPSGQEELQETYQSLLHERFPQLVEVNWQTGVNEELLQEALRILRKGK